MAALISGRRERMVKHMARHRTRVLLFAVLLSATALPAGADAVTLTAHTTAGVILGVAKEFVLGGSYVWSELDWPLLPAVIVGAALELALPVGFTAALEVQTIVPGWTGTMTDSDYLNGDGVKTHYSQSDSWLKGAVMLTAQAGWSFTLPPDQPFSFIAPFLQFEYMEFNWSAENGYLQYPPQSSAPYTPWSPSTTKVSIYGPGILYSQTFLIPAAGLKTSLRPLENLAIDLSIAVSPYMWCIDIDDHLFRFLRFYDTLAGGFMIEPRMKVSLKVTPRATLGLDVLYRHISGLTGDTVIMGTGAPGYVYFPPSTQYPGTTQTSPGSAGVSLDAVSISLFLDMVL
jgi:outer membrane protease